MTNRHYELVTEFLNILVRECTHDEVLEFANIVTSDDLNHPHSQTILNAIIKVAQRGVEAERGDDRISVHEVNNELLEAGSLEDHNLRSTWNNVVAPARPFTGGKYHMPYLAVQIVEHAYREICAKAFESWPDVHDISLSNLMGRVDRVDTKIKAAQDRVGEVRLRAQGIIL